MKKGFTLIELLAVIVIIAIIGSIGIYSVTKIINKSRINSLTDTALAVRRAARLYIADNPDTTFPKMIDLTPGNGTTITKGNEAYLIDLSKDPWGKDYEKVLAEISKVDNKFTIDVYLKNINQCYVLNNDAKNISYCTGGLPLPVTPLVCFVISGTTVTDYNVANPVCPKEVRVPDGVTSIANDAFKSKGLTKVIIPDSVTTIGLFAFYINEISEINIPANITQIADSAFRSNKLTSISIPPGITIIGNMAFGHNQLTNIIIPSSVTTINYTAFYNNKLTSINIPSNVTSIGSQAFDQNPLTSVRINKPAGSLAITNQFGSFPTANIIWD